MIRLTSLLACLTVTAACEPVTETFVDAATDADPTDAIPADATEGSVTITVVGDDGDPAGTVRGMPRAGVDVYFIRPEGTVQKVTSAADGTATATLVAGSFAVVARKPDVRNLYVTVFADLAPGMALTAGDRPDPPATTSTGRVTFTMNPVAGASYYSLATSCPFGFPSGSNGTLTAQFSQGCPQLTSATVVMSAHNSAGGTIMYATRAGLNIPALVNTTQSLGASLAPATTITTYNGIPAGVTSIDNRTQLRQDGTAFGNAQANADVSGATLLISQPIAAVGNHTSIASRYFPTGNLLSVEHRRRVTSQQLTTTLDVGANIIPFSTQPSYDPVSRAGGWTLSGGGPGRRADAFYAQGGYNLPNQSFVSITVIGDGARTSVTLPPLPPELAGFAATVGTTGNFYNFCLIDIVGAAGYADVVETMSAEARQVLYDQAAFPAATEYWFSASNPS